MRTCVFPPLSFKVDIVLHFCLSLGHFHVKDKEYWFNKETKEGRWDMPPSCGWQRMEVMSGPPQYLNYVTGQVGEGNLG